MVFVPKYFFVPELVEKRKPLADNARRAGWVGCNILFDKIPIQGRIPIIENRIPRAKIDVLNSVKQAQKNSNEQHIDARLAVGYAELCQCYRR